jgi:hypothetical protein
MRAERGDRATGRPYHRGVTGDGSAAHLEWWANPSTCLARIPVRLTRAAEDDAWDAEAATEFGEEERDGLHFLVDIDPVFTLRLANDSVTVVVVRPSGDFTRLRLTAVPDHGT